ncbi:MAG: DedA family protein [Tannerellaceae bacterium]|jgi:membrane-associated protein|nr:DedA family protein [Tannerellaceae bacterium]
MEMVLDLFMHLDVHLGNLVNVYEWWVYGILFMIIFCETGLVVTPFLPGDSLLFVAGTLSALPENVLNVHLLWAVLVVAAVLGDAANYTVGRFFGERLFRNAESKVFKRSYLEKTHAFYERHGGKTIILARFVPIIRTFAPFVGGMGKMQYVRFASFNVVGGVIWTGAFLYAGYWFGGLEVVRENLQVVVLGIIVVSVLPGVVEVWRGKNS